MPNDIASEQFRGGFPLRVIAKYFDCDPSTVYKWKKIGRSNIYTRDRVYPEFTWLPTGEWGMTQAQYDIFIAALNEKP